MKDKPLVLLVLVAGIALVGCGDSGSGDMSDQQKIDMMKKAHETPIGPSSGSGAASAAPTSPSATGG